MVFAMFWVYEYFLLEPLFAMNGFGLNLSDSQLDLLALDTVIVALSGYWINDWFDKSIDAINRPNRFLVKWEIGSKSFFLVYGGLLVVGFAISLWLAIQLEYLEFIWIYPLFVGALWFYAARIKAKGFLGNTLVSVAISSIPWLILLAESPSVGTLKAINETSFYHLFWHLGIVSVLMFAANLVREILKDGEDLVGDLAHQSSSLISSIGRKRTNLVLVATCILMIGAEVILVLKSTWLTEIFIQLAVLVAILLLVVSVKAFRAKEKRDFSLLNLIMKMVMLLGMIQIATLSPQ